MYRMPKLSFFWYLSTLSIACPNWHCLHERISTDHSEITGAHDTRKGLIDLTPPHLSKSKSTNTFCTNQTYHKDRKWNFKLLMTRAKVGDTECYKFQFTWKHVNGNLKLLEPGLEHSERKVKTGLHWYLEHVMGSERCPWFW